MLKILLIFLEFIKTGLFAIGGGLATIPFLKEIGYKYNLFDIEFIIKMIAISESTPGPIGINMASYIGANHYNFLAALVFSIGIILPSLIIIIIIAHFLKQFKELKIINNIFFMLRPAVIALITTVLIPIIQICFFKDANINFLSIFLAILLFTTYKLFKLHPILIIIFSAAIGYLLKI